MSESFETTYPRYPFAELVGFGIAFAGLFARGSDKKIGTRLPNGANPATR